jgi:hypothetical protein
MSRVTECADLVLEGQTPGDIQARLGVTQISVNGYLDRAVGESLIRHSDILLNIIDSFRRSRLDPMDPRPDEIPARLRSDIGALLALLSDIEYYRERDGASQLRTDLYSILSAFEASLHPIVFRALAAHFRVSPEAWWEQGVPARVRKTCEHLRDLDKDPQAHPFVYSSFAHLAQIIDAQWDVFKEYLPRKCASRRGHITTGFDRLRLLRNRLAHPTRLYLPSRPDFELADKFSRDLAMSRWRFPKARKGVRPTTG